MTHETLSIDVESLPAPSPAPSFGPPAKFFERLQIPKRYQMHLRCASYLLPVLHVERLPQVVDTLVRNIVASGVRFDTIAFRGLSGAMIAPMIALRTGKEMIAVRKSISNNHSGRFAEGNSYVERYIIVDDLIASGNTVRAIHKAVQQIFTREEQERGRRAELVGIFVYGEEYDYKFHDLRDRASSLDEPQGVPVFGMQHASNRLALRFD